MSRAYTLLLLIAVFLQCAQQSHGQTCNIQDNVNYDTTGDSVTLYNVSSAAACCSACSQFSDCVYFSWVKVSSQSTYQQCQIKNGNSKVISGTSSSTTSGSINRVAASRGAATCNSVVTTTDYNNGFLTYGAASSLQSCCNMCYNYTGCNFYVFTGSQCYLKGSNSSVVANSGTTAGSVVRPRSVPLRTGKRGIAWFNSRSCSDLQKLTEVSWVYNWDVQPDAYLLQCIIDLGIEYIPMQRALPLVLDKVYTGATRLLTFNEPNFKSQANLSPAQAASYWPDITAFAKKYNMKISSPSASAGGDLLDPITWFDQFFAACVGCQVDFLTTHIYTCTPVGTSNYLAQFKKYNLPIWLTEFSCPSAGTTISQASTYLSQTIPYLESDPIYERYAYFGTRIAPSDGWLGFQVNLFSVSSADLSLVGQVYSTKVTTAIAAAVTTVAAATTSTTGKAATSTTAAAATTAKAATTSTTAAATSTTAKAATTGAAATTTSGAATTTGGSSSKPPGYLGCYVDSATRDVQPGATSSSANTVEKCRYYCGVRHYNYSALQYGSQCMCGNSYGSQGAAVDTDCNMACSGNSQQMCGAGYRNSIYSSSNVGYLGCWRDNGGDSNVRDFAVQSASTTTMTVDSCRQLCSTNKYLYAGLQYASECWCSNNYGSLGLGQAPDSDCSMACSGDSTEMCGAGSRNSVFTAMTLASYPGY